MIFVYAYKSSDGVRHEAEMEAPDRDSVFAELRRQGIRAIKVAPKNPAQTVDLTRRVVVRALVLTCSAAVVILGIGWHLGRSAQSKTQAADPAPAIPAAGEGSTNAVASAAAVPEVASVRAKPLVRQYIRGDRARLEKTASTVFANPLDAWLSNFAEPGRMPANSTALALPDALRETIGATNVVDLLREPIPVYANDFTETTDLKRIVAGIKAEALEYIDAGGSFNGFVRELGIRQRTEADYRLRVSRKLGQLLAQAAGSPEVLERAYQHWLRSNAMLESLGIYPLPLPVQLQQYQQTLLDIDEDIDD